MNRGNKGLPVLWALSAAGALLGGLLPSALAQGQGAKTDGFLAHQIDKGGTKGWSHVIARFDAGLSAEQRQQLRGLHCDIYRNLPIIKSVALSVPARHLKQLAALPFVRHLSADVNVRK